VGEKQYWYISNRADPEARVIADRHYNRQKPGTKQFVPPGRCLVLKREDALWITSWPKFARHAWEGAWINSCFRNEGPLLSSNLIQQAISATRWKFPDTPELGMITFINPLKVRKKRDWGRCYRKAGFQEVGRTKVNGLIVLQLLPEDMPEALPPLDNQLKIAV